MSQSNPSYLIQPEVILNKQPIFGVHSIFAGKEKEYPPTEIGDGTILSTRSIIYAGSKIGKKVYIGDGASVRENCEIADEVMIGRNTIVECNTKIGYRSVIQTGAYITADITIGSNVFIGPCTVTTNDRYLALVEIPMEGPIFEDGCRIGANCTILPGIRVGKNSIIGAGSVVTKNIPPEEVWIGNPAKFRQTRSEFDKKISQKGKFLL
jgi:acetyltransferase-like isoleucine patch superfamily enzyme